MVYSKLDIKIRVKVLFVFIMVCVGIFSVYMCSLQIKKEKFDNRIESLPTDIYLKSSKTYYYEKPDDEFLKIMSDIFNLKYEKIDEKQLTVDSGDNHIIEIYNLIIEYVKKNIEINANKFANDGTTETIKVIKANLIAFNLDDKIVKFEVLLYRLGAFAGKHVIFIIRLTQMIDIRIIGNVFADKILLGDINGFNNENLNYQLIEI